MSSRRLVRLSFLAAALGGLLFVVANLVLVGADYDEFAETATTTRFAIQTVLFWLAATCFLFGLVGLYAIQLERAGALGLVAFVLALAGSAFALATTWSETFVLAVLAEEAPGLVDDPPARVAAGLYVSFPVFVAGWLLFAIASARARVLPRRPAIGLLVGAALLVPAVALPGVGAVFGAALAWLGLDATRSYRSG